MVKKPEHRQLSVDCIHKCSMGCGISCRIPVRGCYYKREMANYVHAQWSQMKHHDNMSSKCSISPAVQIFVKQISNKAQTKQQKNKNCFNKVFLKYFYYWENPKNCINKYFYNWEKKRKWTPLLIKLQEAFQVLRLEYPFNVINLKKLMKLSVIFFWDFSL